MQETQETWVQSLGWEDPLENDMTTCSSPVSLPENSHGQRSLVGCSPKARKESDMTEWLSVHAHTHAHAYILIPGLPWLHSGKESTC